MKSMSLLVVMLVAGCGSAQKETETLSESIRSYNEGIRWQRYAVAASSVPPAERSAFVADMDERSEDLRITDYEVVTVDRRGRKEARVQVKVSWYRDTEGSLRETHAIQTWEQHGKDWWMVDETRLRGPEMPGLTNPVAAGETPVPVPDAAP